MRKFEIVLKFEIFLQSCKVANLQSCKAVVREISETLKILKILEILPSSVLVEIQAAVAVELRLALISQGDHPPNRDGPIHLEPILTDTDSN